MFNSDEKKIKAEILKRAKLIAEENYRKEIMFQAFQASDLHYAILIDLMKVAKINGRVSITFKNGDTVVIEDKGDREELAKGSHELY